MRKSYRMLYRLVCVVVTLGAFLLLAQTQRCEDLNHLSLPGIAIRSATPVPAGMYAPPGVTARAVPGLCRVVATVLPELGFEVWLPEKWNRKYIGVGNGGLAGNIAGTAMFKSGRARVCGEQHRYGTCNYQHQHDGVWALGHTDRVINFGQRGVHEMAIASKA